MRLQRQTATAGVEVRPLDQFIPALWVALNLAL